jgi:single-stranded-DNA-specific exonuclease
LNALTAACAWKPASVSREQTLGLARALGLPPLLARVLQARGVDTPGSAEAFLSPALDCLSDPFLLTGMEEAVARITLARERGERVLVFGDYDADGVSGTAIMVRALHRFGIIDCAWDLPSRMGTGYGLGTARVEQAKADGVSLIVTVDNGTSATEAAEHARKLGISLVVTDHHQIEHGLPPADAVVNPAREDPGHPAANACGSMVAFKVARALTGVDDDMDLAALGTVADVMPLRGENRDLVAAGLEWMGRFPKVGIDALARSAKVNLQTLTSEQIAFQLAPRINAAGRMGDPSAALQLLLTDSPAEAGRLAAQLSEANRERRVIEARIVQEAIDKIEASGEDGRRSIVLGDRDWHPGVLGIVAAKLQTQYNVPVVLVAFGDEGIGKGSARSGGDFRLAELLAACQEHLVRFGGHHAAAGMTVEEQRFEAFRERFEEEIRRVASDQAPPELSIDCQAALSEIDGRLVSQLERLQPFGNGNPPPVFCSYGVEVIPGSCREVGTGHLRCALRQGSKTFTAIGFGMGHLREQLAATPLVDVAYTPQFNTYGGETTIQVRLADLQASPED